MQACQGIFLKGLFFADLVPALVLSGARAVNTFG